MKIAALIVAAGRGTRAGPGAPKQWRPLAGRRVVDWTLAAFDRPDITTRALVIHPEDRAEAAALDVRLIDGGKTRSESVRRGLEALAGDRPDLVLIHDVARPCVPDAVIDAVIDALAHAPGAAPALPVTDALWTGATARVTGTRDREGLFRAQTPQGFHFDAILAAHRAHTTEAADDVAVARAFGLDVAITAGAEENLKITLPADFARAESLLKGAAAMRIGTGYDVAPVLRGRSRDALRREAAARARAQGPFRRRCRHACADRRDLWRPRTGRHRPAFSALGSAVERRRKPYLPAPCG